MKSLYFDREISIVISGEAGQGLQTLERMLLRIMKRTGHHVFAFSEVMSRIRGGNNSSELRISVEPVMCFINRIDLFFPIGRNSMSRFADRITPDSLIVGDEGNVDQPYREGYPLVSLPLADAAREIGGPVYVNMIVFGVICSVMGVMMGEAAAFVGSQFKNYSEEEKKKNETALQRGYGMADGYLTGILKVTIPPSPLVKNDMVMYGHESIVLGAITGGCNFISSYPMSPSTPVLSSLAVMAEEFGVVVEQAEDEISAINMAIGAWYAGGRAMVTTSGGGFALMVEGMSLAGCIESPLVVHLGQRPGPATGMLTRTEQGDLLMSLHAGHGEFPRIVLAPGSKEDGVEATHHAFNMADKYQVPVIILTDQYFLESACSLPPIDIASLTAESSVVETGAGYKRYAMTDDGISPRGIPGFGSGLVCNTSDEHSEEGYISEDPVVRVAMVNKRLRKKAAMMADAIPPRFFGNGRYTTLVLSWGSTLETMAEVLKNLDRPELALLHILQVYPLHPIVGQYVHKAKRILLVENSSAAQLSPILSYEIGRVPDALLLKYDGMPFTVEEVSERILEHLAAWEGNRDEKLIRHGC